MIFPSIEELMRGKYNRYELVIATAKAARKIVDIQNWEKEENEKIMGKEIGERSFLKVDAPEEKAVMTAINKLHNREYVIKLKI